jgi:hypothetical protein
VVATAAGGGAVAAAIGLPTGWTGGDVSTQGEDSVWVDGPIVGPTLSKKRPKVTTNFCSFWAQL